MLTGAFLYLPLVFMPEADSLKHPQQFYLTDPSYRRQSENPLHEALTTSTIHYASTALGQ